MKKLLIPFLASISICSTAIAGSPDPVVVPVAPLTIADNGPDWSGFYVGGLISFEDGTEDWYTGSVYNNTTAITGSSYGAFAGYNFQSGSMVYGGEVAYSTGTYTPAGTSTLDQYFVDAKARVGYSTGSALIYGFGGYSSGSVNNGSGNTVNADGYNYGLGIEAQATNNFFVGLEYLVRQTTGTFLPGVNQHDFNMPSAQVRAGWRF